MINDIALIVLAIVLIFNAIAFVRHWQALKAFKIVLNSLAESQRQFNEIVEAEKRKTRNPPPPKDIRGTTKTGW